MYTYFFQFFYGSAQLSLVCNSKGFIYSLKFYSLHNFNMQLSGRAGRNGYPAQCVLFTNRSEVKSCKDEHMVNFCSAKMGCRRKMLLESIGDHQKISTPPNMCCDKCTRSSPYTHLRFIDPIKAPRKIKPTQVRKLSDGVVAEVRNKLMETRSTIFRQSIGMRALGLDIVCPMSCIDEICNKANFIKSVDDLNVIAGLRVKFAEKFFSVFIDIINTCHQ